MSDDMEKRTQQYVAIRDRIKEIEAAAKKELEPLKNSLERLSGIIHEFMITNGLENLKTSAGTCYTTTRRTASLSDPELFMKYVTTNQCFELLDRKANCTAVQAFVKEHKVLPPGCNLSTLETVNVRRGNSSSE